MYNRLSRAKDPVCNGIRDQVSICPVAVSDIESWGFLKGEKGNGDLYIIGSKIVNRYITVPETKHKIVAEALAFFDGSHSISWIQDYLYQHYHKNVDVAGLYRRASESGLIADPPNRQKKRDIEAMSLKLLDLDVHALFKALAPIVGRASLWTRRCFLLTAAMMVLTITLSGRVKLLVQQVFLSGLLFGKNATTVFVVLAFSSIVLHEFAHGLIASHFGLSPKRLRFALYLGFVPIMYLSIPGVYTLARAQRIWVWSGGVLCNFFISLIGMTALSVCSLAPDAFRIVALASAGNLALGLANLYPFLPTDGYFILTTLFHQVNTRSRAWVEFLKWVRFRDHDFNGLVRGYFIGMIVTSSFILWRTIHYIREAEDQHPVRAQVILAAVVIAFLTQIISDVMRSRYQAG